jgi:vitamin-K-epoxide reductase (warfarin-sensitive)
MKYLIALLAAAGLFVSTRAMQVHMMDPSAAPPCAVSEHWDCGSVNHSRYSWFPPKTIDEIFEPKPGAVHIPVALIGMVGYALIALVALTGRIRIVLFLASGGFLCAAYLTYLEWQVIHKWCIYCVWSQGIITAVLLTSLAAVLMARRRERARTEALSQAVD